MHKGWITAGLILLGLVAAAAIPVDAGNCGSRPASGACATDKAGCATDKAGCATDKAGCATTAACATKASAEGASAESMTVVQRAASLGSCDTFIRAVQAADLIGTLSGEGPFTIFVPSDEAFSRIPAAQLDALLKDPDQLAAVLRRHVIAGDLCASSLCERKQARAMAGSEIEVSAQGEEIRVNGAKVLSADLRCRNGRVHIIDQVILPGASS